MMDRRAASETRDHRRELERSAIDHLEGDVNDDSEADITDPALLLEYAAEQIGGDAHQRDRQQQAEGEDVGMLTGSTRNREHVIERHRDVGGNDLHGRLPEGLSGGRSSAAATMAERELVRMRGLLAQLPPHLP